MVKRIIVLFAFALSVFLTGSAPTDCHARGVCAMNGCIVNSNSCGGSCFCAKLDATIYGICAVK